MGFFSLMLFAWNALLQHVPWPDQWVPPYIFPTLQNWALILLTISLPLYAWYAWKVRGALFRPIYIRGTAVLFGVTAGLLLSILTLRVLLLGVPDAGHSAVLLRSIRLLDLTAALILPMVSSFALIMLPRLSHWATRRLVERAGLFT